MQLDSRIEEGSRVMIRRQFEAEVVAISADRLTCQVRPIPRVAAAEPPPFEGDSPAVDGVEQAPVADPATSSPPILVPWNEVKLLSDHL